MRDTIARQSGVDKDSIKYDVEPGTKKYRHGVVTFAVKKGEVLDLNKLRSDIQATRLGKGTNSSVNYFELTAAGEVVAGEKETQLKVSGTSEQFVLADDPKADPKAEKKTAYQRLQEAIKKGEKIASVTGRVQGWSGVWPATLKELAKPPEEGKKPVLIVTDFASANR